MVSQSEQQYWQQTWVKRPQSVLVTNTLLWGPAWIATGLWFSNSSPSPFSATGLTGSLCTYGHLPAKASPDPHASIFLQELVWGSDIRPITLTFTNCVPSPYPVLSMVLGAGEQEWTTERKGCLPEANPCMCNMYWAPPVLDPARCHT